MDTRRSALRAWRWSFALALLAIGAMVLLLAFAFSRALPLDLAVNCRSASARGWLLPYGVFLSVLALIALIRIERWRWIYGLVGALLVLVPLLALAATRAAGRC